MKVDFSKRISKIKPMHAVGQPPFFGYGEKTFKYLEEANIPYSRLHDVSGGNRYVDIPNIFRNFDADENDPTSYDFAFTDWLLKCLMQVKCEPIYRLGITIENQKHIRKFNLDPPADFGKWARVCEHIIRHYNEGWANGFYYNIQYWEIWNEPDNSNEIEKNQMWEGTQKDYFELYTVTSKHLKECFGDKIKIGGYSSCGFYAAIGDDVPEEANCTPRFEYFIEFFNNFFNYIKQSKAPIDFFSWHSYASPYATGLMADWLDKMLIKYGYDIETQLNEWNTNPNRAEKGKSVASATTAAMILNFQNKKTDILCYYDAQLGISVYGGLFNSETLLPNCTYYVFKAFGELYTLGSQTFLDGLDKELYGVAATDGSKNAIMLSNISKGSKKIDLNLDSTYKVYLIDQNHFITESNLSAKEFILDTNQVVIIKNYYL